MSSDESSGQAGQCQVTIRFPQVDRAGIIFYPRYIEIIFQHVAEPPLAVIPVAFKIQFLKPNRLGDRIEITHEHGTGQSNWRIVGRLQGEDCFAVSPLATAGVLPPDAHRSQVPAFKSAPVAVGEWAIDRSGNMHLSRYFEFLSNAIEEWFENALEKPFYQLHIVEGLGIPTVEMNVRCRELPHAGDRINILIRPQKIGRHSLTFRSWLLCGETCLIENTQTIVFVRMDDDGFETILIPDDIRARLESQSTNTGG